MSGSNGQSQKAQSRFQSTMNRIKSTVNGTKKPSTTVAQRTVYVVELVPILCAESMDLVVNKRTGDTAGSLLDRLGAGGQALPMFGYTKLLAAVIYNQHSLIARVLTPWLIAYDLKSEDTMKAIRATIDEFFRCTKAPVARRANDLLSNIDTVKKRRSKKNDNYKASDKSIQDKFKPENWIYVVVRYINKYMKKKGVSLGEPMNKVFSTSTTEKRHSRTNPKDEDGSSSDEEDEEEEEGDEDSSDSEEGDEDSSDSEGEDDDSDSCTDDDE